MRLWLAEETRRATEGQRSQLAPDRAESSQLVAQVWCILGGTQQVDQLGDGRNIGVDLVNLDGDGASEGFELWVGLCWITDRVSLLMLSSSEKSVPTWRDGSVASKRCALAESPFQVLEALHSGKEV